MHLVRYSIVTPYLLKEYEYIVYTLVNENIESTHAHILSSLILLVNFML